MRQIYRLIILVFLVCLGFTVVQGAYYPAINPSPLSQSTSTPASNKAQASILGSEFQVRVHPDDPLYTGDQVSFEIFTPPGVNLTEQELQNVQVAVVRPVQISLGEAKFNLDGESGGLKAVLQWIWNTKDLPAGSYVIRFSTYPQSYVWEKVITLSPSTDLPATVANAAWASVKTDCCILHYVTGTDAERDLEKLKQMVDEEAKSVLAQFNTELKDPIEITFLPRVLGQGGFTTDEVAVSYLNQNYAGGSTRLVIHHEFVHLIDGRLGGEYRPSLFVEGLAVYMSGGHFKPEPLLERAAVLPQIGEYTPLSTLANDFYAQQHEAGYLEAAALIEYMVKTWGWDQFIAFYRDMKPPKDGATDAQVIDTALLAHFKLNLYQLEDQYVQALKNQPDEMRWVDDVPLTIQYYDTVRRYQQVLDPSAYFREVWLPGMKDMRDRGIVADYLRHPSRPVNRVLESLLVAADARLRAGDYADVEALLAKVNDSLDKEENLLPYQRVLEPSPASVEASPHTMPDLPLLPTAQEPAPQPVRQVLPTAGGRE